jgi:hypothetical protein
VVWSEGGRRTDSLVWTSQFDCWSGLTKSDGLNGQSGGFRRTDWTIASSDWSRLAQFPSFFLLLFGVFIWTNFSRYGPGEMYLDFPVILIGVTAIVILLPFLVLAHRSRKWFAYSHVSFSRHRELTPSSHSSYTTG